MNAAVPAARFGRRPSPVAYMLRAFHPTPGLRRAGRFPPLRVTWTGQRIDRNHLATFLELTRLDVPGPAGWQLLYPHVVGFPLLMVVLTHPDFPVPIWRVLQIRNHLVRHRPIDPDQELDWETSVGAQRLLPKGAEVDLHTVVSARGEVVWESLNTFYFRGSVAGEDPPSPLNRPPEVGDEVVASWHMPAGIGWRFAGLTGDFNGIHVWDRYARWFGFRRAFHHPQVVIGQALARLPAVDQLPQRLDVWLKGPVYYDSDVHVRGTPAQRDAAFAVHVRDDDRPAIVGRWTAGSDVL